MPLNLREFNKKMQQLEEELIAKRINVEEVFISYNYPGVANGDILLSNNDICLHLEPTEDEAKEIKYYETEMKEFIECNFTYEGLVKRANSKYVLFNAF